MSPPVDFILSLRPCIVTKSYGISQPASISRTSKCLDLASYWKSKHTQQSVSVEGLQHQLASYQFQLQKLHNELAVNRVAETPQPELPSPSNAGRKRVHDNIRQSPRKVKRQKEAVEPIETEEEEDDWLELDYLSDVASPQCLCHLRFMMAFVLTPCLDQEVFTRNVELRRLIESNNAFLAFDLAYSLQRTTRCISSFLSRASTSQARDHDPESLDNTAFRLLALTIENVFRAFERLVLHRISPEQELQNPLGAAIFAIVSLFRSYLTILKEAAEYDLRQSVSAVRTSAQQSNSRNARQTPPPTSFLAVLVRDLMKKILTSALDLHNSKTRTKPISAAHKDLVEGLQHVLITEAGSLLYTICFGRRRRDSIDEELANASHPLPSGPNNGHNMTAQIASAQARHLFPLLRLVIEATTNEQSSRRRSAKNQQNLVQSSMVTKPLRQLQNTLIQGVFGVTDEDDLEDALKLPEEVILHGRGRKAVQVAEEGGEWFIKSMWELCGWDHLAKAG